MKKILLITGILAMTINSFAQVKIKKHVDEMTDEVDYMTSERFFAANDALTKGCAIDMVINSNDGVKESTFFLAKMVGLESCNEDNTIIFLFENGKKFSLESFNKFNCKGTAYFRLSESNIKLLKTLPISKVRIKNGRSLKNYTSEIKYKTYFIEFYNELSNN